MDEKKIELKIEELEERIAPRSFKVSPPGLGGEEVVNHNLNDTSQSQNAFGGLSNAGGRNDVIETFNGTE